MKNAIKRSLLIGIGAVAATKPRVKKVLQEFEKAGLLRRKQVNEVLGAVLSEAKRQHKILESHIQSQAGSWKRKADALAKRLEARGRETVRKAARRAEKEMR